MAAHRLVLERLQHEANTSGHLEKTSCCTIVTHVDPAVPVDCFANERGARSSEYLVFPLWLDTTRMRFKVDFARRWWSGKI